MISNVAEQLRSNHEDIERYERVICDLQKTKAKTVCVLELKNLYKFLFCLFFFSNKNILSENIKLNIIRIVFVKFLRD